MNVIKSSITCDDCENLLEKPIVIQCGRSVCLRHVENLPDSSYNCKSCGHEHKINREYLFVNKNLEDLVKANLDKISFCYEYTIASEYCSQLKDLIDEMEALKKDAAHFIHETIGKLKNQTELVREEFKIIIDSKANKLIDDLNEYERMCKSILETNEFKITFDKIANDLSTVSKNLNEWENTLNNFEMKFDQLDEIKGKCRDHQINLNKKMFNFKRELLMHNLKQFFDRLNNYSYLIKCSKQEQPNLDLIQDLKQLCENGLSLECSKIVNTTALQRQLTDLCEFNHDMEWRLIYRASRDGFSADDFHDMCDDIHNTVTIIKSTEGNIFGGFTDVAWDCLNEYKASLKAFIFSLLNKNNEPFKVEIDPNNSKYAICCHESYGPIFGQGNDIQIVSNSNADFKSYSNFLYSYKHPNKQNGSADAKTILAGSFYFKVVDIEVYKIDS